MAGVTRTDWSWSPLIADLDLDGYKDIYVTDGLAKDVTSQDYIAFLANRETMIQATSGGRVDFKRLVDPMSSTQRPNYACPNRRVRTPHPALVRAGDAPPATERLIRQLLRAHRIHT